MRLPLRAATAIAILSILAPPQGASAQTRSADPPSAVVCEFARKGPNGRYTTTVRLAVDWSRQYRTAVTDPRNAADPFRRMFGGEVWEGTVQINNSNRVADTAPIAISAMVTQRPSGPDALVFYWLHERFPMVVRADWSMLGTRKDATYFDALRDELVEGTCR